SVRRGLCASVEAPALPLLLLPLRAGGGRAGGGVLASVAGRAHARGGRGAVGVQPRPPLDHAFAGPEPRAPGGTFRPALNRACVCSAIRDAFRRNAMLYRRLGRTGLQLSALSFGAWVTFGRQVGRSQARELLALAWDHGINFFDNAEAYANGEAERVMGDVIADLRLPRDGFCVSSKVFFGSAESPRPTQRGLSRKHVVDACHAALRRLR